MASSYFPWAAISSSPRNPQESSPTSSAPPQPPPAPPPLQPPPTTDTNTQQPLSRPNTSTSASTPSPTTTSREPILLPTKSYPSDAPPISIQWYHAVDIPKRKPFTSKQDPPLSSAKKYVLFSSADSARIETAYQKGLEVEQEENLKSPKDPKHPKDPRSPTGLKSPKSPKSSSNSKKHRHADIKVMVNEDYLFDVDIHRRELAPAYWIGPSYDVRRGTWFFVEGNNLRPANEELAGMLEEGYLKCTPWKFPSVIISKDQQKSQPESNLLDKIPEPSARSFTLWGPHSESTVTYEDSTTAYILTNGYLASINSTLYQRFSGGAHYAGVKVVRGYSEQNKKATTQITSPTTINSPTPMSNNLNSSSAISDGNQNDSAIFPESPISIKSPTIEIPEVEQKSTSKPNKETPRQILERKMSSLAFTTLNWTQQQEHIRKQEEEEIREDYQEDGIQNREVEHLILITHGIGQRLGLRLESSSFIHDVNSFRKNIKAVYSDSQDLQALNSENEETENKNSRIQVLPICWRHLLDFPRHSLKHNRKKHDLGDNSAADDENFPSLEDISVPGVPAIRNIVTDLGLDLLLYQSNIYKPHISRIIINECNRIYKLFKTRNPTFKGKVSLLGHSLGSALLFDILCSEAIDDNTDTLNALNPTSFMQSNNRPQNAPHLSFEVEDFYCMGSPIGLYQMLKGRTIAARGPKVRPATTPYFPQTQNPFDTVFSEVTTSSPKCAQLYNIFHPTDPIAYRIEPLISPAMTSLPPQPLPYTKKGMFAIAGNQGAGRGGSGIGATVATMWNTFSSGIASSILNHTLGLSNEQVSRLSSHLPNSSESTGYGQFDQIGGGGSGMGTGSALPTPMPGNSEYSPFMNYKTNGPPTPGLLNLPLSATSTTTSPLPLSAEDAKRIVAQSSLELEHGSDGTHPPTLLDTGIETLFSGFQKAQGSSVTSNNTSQGIKAGPTTHTVTTSVSGVGSRTGSPIESQFGVAATPAGVLGIPSLVEASEKLSASATNCMFQSESRSESQPQPQPPTASQAQLQDLLHQTQPKDTQSLSLTSSASTSASTSTAAPAMTHQEAQRMRREEAKVRALNRSGRVDFSIQEGAFELGLVASLASHVGYWADEDVAHFVVGQILSRQRIVKGSAAAGPGVNGN